MYTFVLYKIFEGITGLTGQSSPFEVSMRVQKDVRDFPDHPELYSVSKESPISASFQINTPVSVAQ